MKSIRMVAFLSPFFFLGAQDSGAPSWAWPTKHTLPSPLHWAPRTARISQTVMRPSKTKRQWSWFTPRSPRSSPSCATSPATRSRSTPATTPPTPAAAAWRPTSAPARCLKVRRPIELLRFVVRDATLLSEYRCWSWLWNAFFAKCFSRGLDPAARRENTWIFPPCNLNKCFSSCDSNTNLPEMCLLSRWKCALAMFKVSVQNWN